MMYLLALSVAVVTSTSNEYRVCTCRKFAHGARPGDVMCQGVGGRFCDRVEDFGGRYGAGCGYREENCILEATCPCAEGQYEQGAKDGDMMCYDGINCALMQPYGVCMGKNCFLKVGRKKETQAPEQDNQDHPLHREPFKGCDKKCAPLNVVPCECIANLVQWFNRQERIALDNEERVLKEMSSYPLAAVQGLANGAKVWAEAADRRAFPWTNYQHIFSSNMWHNGQPNWMFTAQMAKDFSASLQYAVVEMKKENEVKEKHGLGRFVSEDDHVTGTGMIAGMAGFAGAGLVAAAVLYTYVGKKSTVEESMA